MNTLILAGDPGFGNFKFAWLGKQNHIETCVIPSVAGIGQISDLSLLGLGRQRKQARPYTVGWGGVEYLVGANVHRHAEPIEDLDKLRLTEGGVNRSLMYAALGQAVNGQPTPVKLMLGFPVELLKDKERARIALRALRGWLEGQHRFTVDGRAVDLTVLEVKGAAQPVGAYLDWGMDNAGQWVRETEALQRPVGVCDLGFNTLDLFSLEGGEVTDRETAGGDLGMHRVAATVKRFLYHNYRVELGLHRCDDLVQEYLKTGQVIFYCAAGDIDLSGVVQQALEKAFTDIREFIRAHWGGGAQFHTLIFTGGGAQAFRPQFLRYYPAAYLPADMVTSNARGLLKRAVRVFGQ